MHILCYWKAVLEILEHVVRKTAPHAVFRKCYHICVHITHTCSSVVTTLTD